jgi:CHASE3 domain sensor protein
MEHQGLEEANFAMTTNPLSDTFTNKSPGGTFLRNLNIGTKLTLGFGLLVILALVVVGFSYWGSSQATEKINRTDEVRVPTALTSASAQANLLRMLGDVRGYLALGEGNFRDSYKQSRQNFEADLAALEKLSPALSPKNQERLIELRLSFNEWSELPDQLFELRDDQLAREPAYRILATEGLLLGGSLLIETQEMISAQAQESPTEANINLITDLAQFQSSFASMVSGLRGYATTRNRDFKVEYRGNLTVNRLAWDRIQDKRALLDSNQQARLDAIAQNRQAFLELPDEIFAQLESDAWRQDLYLFSTEAVPRATQMQQSLAEITTDQQTLLQTDLNAGRTDLTRANQQTLTAAVIALILGVGLAYIFRQNIAGPVVRLTNVAERIRHGDLKAQAEVESGDEIGILAETFNNMTAQLRDTLNQVRKEKNRADSLLEVVIPIGVELTTEKDFNRLLEKMLLEAKTFCKANAGVLYLRREPHLKPVIVRNDTLDIALGGTTGKEVEVDPLPLTIESETGQKDVAVEAAISRQTINIADLSKATGFAAPQIFNGNGKGVWQSFLSIPLKNSEGDVLGVLELINAQDPETRQIISFDQNLQQMMESFSSLAVAALEAYLREQSLKQEIQRLRIEIDEAKRQQEVKKIVESDTFKDLQAKAEAFRQRARGPRRGRSKDKPSSETGEE